MTDSDRGTGGGGGDRDGGSTNDAGWPVDLDGVTETVVTTEGPHGSWNVAALGVHADADVNPDPDADPEPRSDAGDSATAYTYGDTRTRRNFRRSGEGYVQFTDDPLLFVDAALAVQEVDDPVLPAAAAWARVEADRVEVDESGDTRVETWALTPVEAAVVAAEPPRFDRGRAAVVEATVAASRLDVPGYDAEELRERLRFFEETARTCGGDRVQEAFDRLNELVDWRDGP